MHTALLEEPQMKTTGLVILLALAVALAVAPLSADVPKSVSAMAFGAKGDGVTDDTAAIQKALDSLGTAGGIVNLPAGRYLISAELKVPKYATLMGEGERWENSSTGLIVATNGFSAVRLSYGSGVKALQISYPKNRGVENPKPYPPTILIGGCNAVENIVFDCAWIGVSTLPGGNNGGQSVFRDIEGFVHSVGMHISGCRDLNRFEDIHWFAGGTGDQTKAYYIKNRVGFEFGDVDGVFMDGCFIIRGKTFLHQLPIKDTPDGKPARAHSLGFQIDRCWTENTDFGFIFEGACGFVISNSNILIRENGVGIKVVPNSLYYNAAITTTQVRGYGKPLVGIEYTTLVPHQNNRLSIADCQVTGGSPAVHLGPGAIRANIHDNHFVSAPGQPAIQIDKGADLIVITNNVLSSADPIVDNSGDKASKNISGNLMEK
jgi:hypothetical protein